MGRAVARLQQPAALLFAAFIVGIAIVVPLAEIALSMEPASLRVFQAASTWVLLVRTLALASLVTLLALVVGVPLGAFFARARLPGVHVWLVVHALPLFLPPLILALGWFHLVGERGIIGSPAASTLFFGPVGLVFVLTVAFAPVVTILTMLGLSGIDPSVEEAGLLGADPRHVLFRLLVPAARPSIALGATIVFALTLAEVGVPMFLRVNVYGAAVFTKLGSVSFAPGEAAALSLPMVVFAMTLVGVERRLERKPGGLRLRPRSTPRFDLGVTPFVFAGGAALLAIAPLLALAMQGFRGFAVLPAWLGASPWTSITVACGAAVAATTIALIVGHARARRSSSAGVVDTLLVVGFFVPSAVLGTGIVAAWNRPGTAAIYGTLAVVVLALVARYAALAVRTLTLSVRQTSPSYEDAAVVFGATYARRLARVVVPMHRRALAGAFGLTAVFCLRDLETTVLFYPPGGETLTVRFFTLEANGPPAVVAAIALVQIALTLAVAGAVAVTYRRMS